MIKVMFLIHDLGGGGAEKILVNVVNNLNKELFDITVISLFGGGVNEKFLDNNIKYRIVFKYPFPGNSQILKILSPSQLHRLIFKEKFDVEVSFLEGPTARIVSGCKDQKVKLINWVHVQQRSVPTAIYAFRSYKEAYESYKKYDYNVCVSNDVRDDFYNLFKLNNSEKVIYNPIDVDLITRLSREEISFEKGNAFLIVGIGKLLPNKGFSKLIDIHKCLHNSGYSIKTLILGSGPEEKNLRNQISKYKLSDEILLLGYLENPYTILKMADLFVCSSNSEGFSTASAESLILGVPVVSTPVAGISEMLDDWAEIGVSDKFDYTSLLNKIKILIDNPTLLKQYAIKTHELSKQFSLEANITKIERLMIELVGKK